MLKNGLVMIYLMCLLQLTAQQLLMVKNHSVCLGKV